MDRGKEFAVRYGCYPADLTKELEQEITEQTEVLILRYLRLLLLK